MARRRFLIAYDITDPKRLRRVLKVMKSYGTRLQYSVFLCDLSGVELTRWQTEMLLWVRLTEDSVVWIDLGASGSSAKVNVLGVPRTLPAAGPVVL